MLNTIFALKGSSECSVQWNNKTSFAHKFFVPSGKRHSRTEPSAHEYYNVKNRHKIRPFFITYICSPLFPCFYSLPCHNSN